MQNNYMNIILDNHDFKVIDTIYVVIDKTK